MSDLISRQAAIDALCNECQGRCIPCEHYPCGEVKALEQLPSAQPEIVRCKDCRFASPNKIYGCILERFSLSDKHERLYADDFCSRAERRVGHETD